LKHPLLTPKTAEDAEIDRLEYECELEDATTSSSFGRVVWERTPTIETHTLDVVGLAKSPAEFPTLRGIHVGDTDFWFNQLVEDYSRDAHAWEIDIYPVEGDYYTDDPQYVIPDESGNKGDSYVLITRRKVLKEGVDFNYVRELTAEDLPDESQYDEDEGEDFDRYASARKKAAPSITETPAFKAWFRNSKAVNPDGSPMVVYHGTRSDFDIFKTDSYVSLGSHFGTQGQANYILSNPEYPGAKILPCYLSIQNPLRLPDAPGDEWHWDYIVPKLRAVGIDPGRRPRIGYEAYVKTRRDQQDCEREMIVFAIEDAGYDGIVYDNAVEGKGDSWIIFHPNQVKSAIGNNGEFSPEKNNVTASAPHTETEDEYRRRQHLQLRMGIPLPTLLRRDPACAESWLGYTGQPTITIYRGSDVDRAIEPGDFVTTSRETAEVYGPYIQSKGVPARDLRYVRGAITGKPHNLDVGGMPELIYAPRQKKAAAYDEEVTATGDYKGFKLTADHGWHELGDEVEEDGWTDWNLLIVTAQKGTEFAGSAEFIVKDGKLIPNNTEVRPEFRRQGLATAMYVFAEKETGLPTRPHSIQSPEGRALWRQNNCPFGKSGSPKKATLTPKQARVFGPVYHGTPVDFDEFKLTKGTRTFFGLAQIEVPSGAFFFTDDPRKARNWADNRRDDHRGPLYVIEAYLKMANPLDLRDSAWVDTEIKHPPLPFPGEYPESIENEAPLLEVLRDLTDGKLNEADWREMGIDIDRLRVINDSFLFLLVDTPAVVEALKFLKFDGIIMDEGEDPDLGGTSYAVFNANQIEKVRRKKVAFRDEVVAPKRAAVEQTVPPLPAKLYHGTSMFGIVGILKDNAIEEGVHWGRADEPHGVRLTKSRTVAEDFAIEGLGGDEGAIIELRTADLARSYQLTEYQDVDCTGERWKRDEEEVVVLTEIISPAKKFISAIYLRNPFKNERSLQDYAELCEQEGRMPAEEFLRRYARLLKNPLVRPLTSGGKRAMKITVPPQEFDHFWEDPPPGHDEFWAFRWPVRAKVGDQILFHMNKKPVAEAVISRIEKPGESECERTGRFKNMWKVFWKPESFKKIEAKKAAAKEPWEMSREEFYRTHSEVKPGFNSYAEGERLSALPDDTVLWVYTATDREHAEDFLKHGVDPAKKPTNLARSHYENGEYAEYAPGRGLASGLYVGLTPQGVSGYGRVILALRVRKGDLKVPPEQAALNRPNGCHALVCDDAYIDKFIPPSDIREIGKKGRYPRDGYTELTESASRIEAKQASEAGSAIEEAVTTDDGRKRHHLKLMLDGEEIGHLDAIVNPDHVKVDGVFVKPEYRRRGYGVQLYRKAEEIALAHGLPEIRSAYSVSPDAQRVWRSIGGEEFDDHGVKRWRLKVAATQSYGVFEEAAQDAREKVFGAGPARNGHCEPTSDALYDILKAQGYDPGIAYGYYKNAHHSWVQVGDIYIDPTHDQFGTPDIRVGKTSDRAFKRDYEVSGLRRYASHTAATLSVSSEPTKLYHVTSPRHRRSIQRKGLLAKQPRGAGHGADPGVYGCESPEAFYPGGVWDQPNIKYLDIWEFPTEGLSVRRDEAAGMDGCWFTHSNIPPEKLRLYKAGESVEKRANGLRRLTREQAIAILRRANENGKNKDSDAQDDFRYLRSGPYVQAEMPLADLDYLSQTPDREQFYAAVPGKFPPVYAVLGERTLRNRLEDGEPLKAIVTNGNHRCCAAEIRGDSTVPTIMLEEDYARLQTAKKAADAETSPKPAQDARMEKRGIHLADYFPNVNEDATRKTAGEDSEPDIPKGVFVEALESLNEHLKALGTSMTFLCVGGGAMMFAFGTRDKTQDLDGVLSPDNQQATGLLQTLAAEVAEQFRDTGKFPLPDIWINTQVRPIMKDQGYKLSDFDPAPEYSWSNLKLMFAKPEKVLAMKCVALREGKKDFRDVQSLVQRLGIKSIEQLRDVITPYIDWNYLTESEIPLLKLTIACAFPGQTAYDASRLRAMKRYHQIKSRS